MSPLLAIEILLLAGITTIAVPFATSDSLGLPDEGNYTGAGTWIMEAGTSAAHIMLPGQ